MSLSESASTRGSTLYPPSIVPSIRMASPRETAGDLTFPLATAASQAALTLADGSTPGDTRFSRRPWRVRLDRVRAFRGSGRPLPLQPASMATGADRPWRVLFPARNRNRTWFLSSYAIWRNLLYRYCSGFVKIQSKGRRLLTDSRCIRAVGRGGASAIVFVRCGDSLRLPGPESMGAAGSGLGRATDRKCGEATPEPHF